MNDHTEESFEALLCYLRDTRGADFTGYKRTSLSRRIQHRMERAGIPSFEEYLDVLQASSDEFDALFDTILINVTAFYRDPEAWQFIHDEVVPALVASRAPDQPIRIWSAGCASGQEAYTLAMILADSLEPEAFRHRVKIYATDLDEQALAQARAASYDARSVAFVPEPMLARYFTAADGRYQFDKDLRRAVIFGRNDLVKDAPISRVDLLVCRNTLMYLNAETQRKVLKRLHFALAPEGVIFLGHAEMLLSHTDKFTPIELKHRIFRRAAGSLGELDTPNPPLQGPERQGNLSRLATIRELAFGASPVAQIVVTNDDTVAMINHQAQSTFGLSARDIGRLLRDLQVSYRPAELRAYVEQAKVERRSARVEDVKWQRPGTEPSWFEIHVNPLVDTENGLIGVSIVFFDVTANRVLLDKLVQTNSQLEAAYEELQSTNEELETTNEELQSTVEELETTNEELQSTNEELETINEESQSTNDELNTINDTLRDRSVELEATRTFLNSMINSLAMGVIVIDRDMRVVEWNRGSEELWGIRSDEAIGALLTGLDIGLPLGELKPLIGNALVDPEAGGQALVKAVNRRGRHIDLRVTCTSFRSTQGAVSGALLLVDDGT